MANISLIPQHMVKGLESDLNDKVSKTGDEEIAGQKTFNLGRVIIKHPDVDLTTIPASDTYTGLHLRDKNNNNMAAYQNIQTKNGDTCASISVRNKDNTSWMKQPLQVGFTASGYEFCVFPTPVNPAENSNQGATTKWTNSRIIELMNSNGGGISESGTNYVKFNNGLLIQWGYNGAASGTVTYPKPFTNNPSVQITGNNSSPNSGNDWFGCGAKNVTTTNFFGAQGSSHTSTWGFWWIAIGY